ncbi:hypothetical protein CR492_11730 [Methylocella silvestris]|uniref:Uncharacterized protein n=2 Tax=Methylocella silvestris TaxID=199596 RepID=A0A2J7TG89_METSI|nr:hypothetical protein CR492_11730 [Methylocella silvestris]
MIEQAMAFVLGFAIAGLLALAIAPAFWRRAIRLSTRRLEMLVPLSTREIIAERDLLRAQFAVERRVIEQRAAQIASLRGADMAELGRRAAQLVEGSNRFAELAARHAAQGAELSAALRALDEAKAELAVAGTALYGAEGLLQRKHADLVDATLEARQLRASDQGKTAIIADYEADIAMRQRHLAAARDDVATLRETLATLGLERDASLAALKAAAAQLADRDEALKAAESREAELQRRRKRQVETARAAERRMFEKIARVGAAESTARQQLAAERQRADGLAQELETTRRLSAARDGAPAATEREENAILRQNINEIGAAIIRMAAIAHDSAKAPFDDGAENPGRAHAKPNVVTSN